MNLMKWARNQWDRVAAVALMLAAAGAMLAGWFGVSRSAYTAESLPYIVSGGFFGLLLIGVGAVLWLSADLRDEWRKLDRIEQAWVDVAARPLTPPAVSQPRPDVRATSATR
jgi:hypothetical protein